MTAATLSMFLSLIFIVMNNLPLVTLDLIAETIHYTDLYHCSSSTWQLIILLKLPMPVLKRLKVLSSTWKLYLNYQPLRLMHCNYKFRSSLTHLDLSFLIGVLLRNIGEIIPAHIKSFSLLTHLNMCSETWINKYRETGIESNSYHCGSPDTYPQPKNLELNMHSIDQQYTSYIRRKLIAITHLKMDASYSTVIWIKRVLDDIKSCKALNYYHINIHVTRGSSLHRPYIGQFMEYPFTTINEIICAPNKTMENAMSFTYDKHTQTREVLFTQIDYPGGLLEDTFENIGSCFDTLKIVAGHIKGVEGVYSYQIINEVFSRLSYLEVDDMGRVSTDGVTIPNFNMKTLKAGKVQINNPWLRNIEIRYPSLKTLVLSLNKRTEYNLTQLQLPNTGLISLTLDFPIRARRHRVIIKEVDGCSVKVWFYNYQTKYVTYAENSQAESFLRMSSARKRITMISISTSMFMAYYM
ncbi:hypothetical protein BDB01DRAFT_840302 [Pilobolus umbonatus]|nr:hypothetical protein BDB01DRAFT_840302 [Pilobolus umbonatus]